MPSGLFDTRNSRRIGCKQERRKIILARSNYSTQFTDSSQTDADFWMNERAERISWWSTDGMGFHEQIETRL
jgi:hypothetical protein